MAKPITRRELIAGAAAAAALPAALRAQPASAPLDVRAIRGNVVQIAGAGANVTVASTASGLLLVDGGAPEQSPALLNLLSSRWPGLPVQTLFNTNWREEHAGLNTALRKLGARIVAHENTKLWQGADFVVEWERRTHRPAPPESLPTDTFYTNGKLDFGTEAVSYAVLPRAHTDGDLYVHFPGANVLAVSDVLAVGRYPVPDYATGGWIGGLEKATKTLLDLADDETLIVPAVGPAQTRAALRGQLELCAAVRTRVAEAFRGGMSLADFAASKPTREFDAERGDPAQFLALVYKGALGHSRELGGVI